MKQEHPDPGLDVAYKLRQAKLNVGRYDSCGLTDIERRRFPQTYGFDLAFTMPHQASRIYAHPGLIFGNELI